jgi:hypothetical protein
VPEPERPQRRRKGRWDWQTSVGCFRFP